MSPHGSPPGPHPEPHPRIQDGPDSGPEDAPEDGPQLSARDEALLAEAAQSLRRHTDARWVEVSSTILSSALRATRRSRPVRAGAPGGTVHISEQVIVSYLREALDGHIPGTAIAGIHLDIADHDTFNGVLIDMIIQYGTEILPVADHTRAIAATVLEELLGPLADGIYIRTSHVHVSDVTTHDPQTE